MQVLNYLDLAKNELRNARIQNLSAAPSSPVAGQAYYDTTLNQFGVYNGTAWVYLASGVTSVTAADGTVTITPTTGAVTVKVAKALDHTWITDFDTQVRTSRLDQMAAPTADVSINSHKLTNVTDPTSAQDAATKNYVDTVAQGLSPKGSVAAATTAALPANTYANGASGVGATLTATTNGALGAIDGQTPIVGMSILVKNEAAPANNGVYTVTQVGDGTHPYILTRRTDIDAGSEFPGAYVFVETGSTLVGTTWAVETAGAITVGTTGITFTQIGGPGVIIGGTGISVSGNTVSLVTPVTLANGGTGSGTAAGARTSLGATGKAASDIGNGSLTSIDFAHNLNSLDVVVMVKDKNTPANQIMCDVQIKDANTVTLIFATAPTAAQYRVVVVG